MTICALQEPLDKSAAAHDHLRPRQDLPQGKKRLLAIVETDGCFADSVSVTCAGQPYCRTVGYSVVLSRPPEMETIP